MTSTKQITAGMDYVRYLKSKRTVDDRALDEHVLQDAENYFQEQCALRDQSRPLRVVEVGAGVGAMCCRLHQRGTFSKCGRVEYLLIDFKAEVILEAKNIIQEMVLGSSATQEANRYETSLKVHPYVNESDPLSVHHLRSGKVGEMNSKLKLDLSAVQLNENFSVSFAVCDALEFAETHADYFDIVIAAAVLDLWELTQSVPRLLSMLRSDGLNAYYFPINFDGTTALSPPTSEGLDFDGRMEVDFHKAMGYHKTIRTDSEEFCALAAHTGRQLLTVLRHIGAQVRAAGSSGWIVLPSEGKRCGYPHDEKYFLQCIIDFIQTSVPGARSGINDKEWKRRFDRYIQDRRDQIERGVLCYIAHNIDVFGTWNRTT